MSKEFVVEDVTYTSINITPEIRVKGQQIYAKALGMAINNDAPLRIQIDKMLRDKGLMNDKEEQEQIDDIRKELRSLEKKLRGAKREDGTRMTKNDGKLLAFKMKDLRAELNTIGRDRSECYSNCAERQAENEQMQYFIYACTRKSDGAHAWISFEEYKETDPNDEVLSEAMNCFLLNAMGVDVDVDGQFYENQWLKRMGFMNDKYQLIDAQGRTVDTEGRLIDSEGRYIDEDGNLVDIYGNIVDEDGNLVVEDGWDE